MISDELDVDETPDVIAQARALIENLTPENPCTGWPCEVVQKACLEIARLELKIQELQAELKCLEATVRTQ